MNPSFELVPGHPDSGVVLHVPHSSRVIPPAVRAGILLDDAALAAELDAMTDTDTDRIALRAADLAAAEGPRPWVFLNRCSRLVVDPERFPDDTEEMNAVGMGAVYTATSRRGVLRAPTDAERDHLIATWFTPYAAAITDLVQQRLDACGAVTVLDLHSYPREPLPYELHGDGPRPEVCLGTDPVHTPPALLEAARARFATVAPTGDVGLDSPFAGCYVPLRHYGVEPRVRGLMLELRRDVVAARLASLAAATAALVASPACASPAPRPDPV